MKVDVIDLKDFFDDKYRYLNGEGIGAVSVITQKQMVTRFNEAKEEKTNGNFIKGLGGHGQEKLLILEDIFDFPEGFSSGNGLMPNVEVWQSMSSSQKQVVYEVVEVRFVNSSAGNIIAIILPNIQNSLTTKQIQAIEYLGDMVEEISQGLSKPIQIFVGNSEEFAEEENSVRKEIIPFLNKFINDDYIQSVEDVNFIASEDIVNTYKTV